MVTPEAAPEPVALPSSPDWPAEPEAETSADSGDFGAPPVNLADSGQDLPAAPAPSGGETVLLDTPILEPPAETLAEPEPAPAWEAPAHEPSSPEPIAPAASEAMPGAMEGTPGAMGATPAALSPALEAQLTENLEKMAWDAFGDLAERIVKDAVERIERVAWEVIPKMAETLVREEIRKMKDGEES